jgi:hypothetical protein
MFAQRSSSGIARLLALSLLAGVAIPATSTARDAPPAHAAKLKRCPDPGPDAAGWVQLRFRVRGVTCRRGSTKLVRFQSGGS